MGERCHFYLLKLYFYEITHVLPIAVEKDIFYLEAKCEITFFVLWAMVTRNVLGHNTLDKLLKRMLQDTAIDNTNKSNHSLCATAITRIMEKNVPSKVIMQRSGHLSKDGLVPYERTTPLQQQSSDGNLYWLYTLHIITFQYLNRFWYIFFLFLLSTVFL